MKKFLNLSLIIFLILFQLKSFAEEKNYHKELITDWSRIFPDKNRNAAGPKFFKYIIDKKINLKIPVTMIHGSNDTTVPISLSRKVLKLFNNAKKKLLIIKNGDHSLFSKKLQKKIVRELDFFL